METKKVDRRVRKTKKQIKEALVKLLQTKPIQEIKVSEIADLIDINRGTFYQHYTDVYDLLAKTEDEVFEELHHLLIETKENVSDQDDYHQIQEAFDSFLNILLTYIKNNVDLTKALFGPYGDHVFIMKLQNLVKEEWLENRVKIKANFNEREFNYLFSYLASGTIQIITSWIQCGMVESPKELAKLIDRIVLKGAQTLL